MSSTMKSVLDRVGMLSPLRNVRRWFADLRFSRYYSQHDLYEVYIHGRRIAYSTKDEYSGRWFFPRYHDKIHEPRLTELLVRLSQNSENVIDVGANLGWFTCIAASISSATVHAFELDEDNMCRLRTNVELNELDNVRVRHTAVVDSEGHISYRKKREGAGVEHNLTRCDGDGQDQVQVEATTLDRYVREHCQSVDLIKIDVEGAEQKVLEGAQRTMREFNPHFLLEVHPSLLESLGTSVQVVLSKLPDTYKIYYVEDFRQVGQKQEAERRRIDPSVFDPDQVSLLHGEPPGHPLSDFPLLSGPLYEFV